MDRLTSEELKHINDLKKEYDIQGTSSDKLDWMYGDPSKVDSEDYLLGKKIEDKKNHVEHECVPPSLRNLIVPNEIQVDLQRKIQEDPLYEIKRKEIEARKKLFENPLKLKQIQKEKLKHLSKKSTDDEGDDDLDKKILEAFLKIKSKKKKKKKSGTKKKHKKEKQKSSSDVDSSSEEEKNVKKRKKQKSRSVERDSSYEKKNKKYKKDKPKRSTSNEDKMKTKIYSSSKSYQQKKYRNSEKLSSSSDSSDDEKINKSNKIFRNRSDKSQKFDFHKREKYVSPEKSSSEEKMKQFRNRSRSRSKESKQYSYKEENKKLDRKDTNSGKSKDENRKYHKRCRSKEIEIKNYSKHEFKNKVPKGYEKYNTEEYSSKHTNKSTRVRGDHDDKQSMKSVDKKKEKHRNYRSKSRSPTFSKKSSSNDNQIEKSINSYKTSKKSGLSEEEKKQKLKEMMENAEWSNDVREKEKTIVQNEDLENYEENPEFLRQHLLKSLNMSIETRTKSKINSIQKSSADMEKSFVKR